MKIQYYMRASAWFNFLDPNWSHISYSADFYRFLQVYWPNDSWCLAICSCLNPEAKVSQGSFFSKHPVLEKNHGFPWWPIQGDGWSYGSNSSQRSWYRWLSRVEFRCGSSGPSIASIAAWARVKFQDRLECHQKIRKKSQVFGVHEFDPVPHGFPSLASLCLIDSWQIGPYLFWHRWGLSENHESSSGRLWGLQKHHRVIATLVGARFTACGKRSTCAQIN